MVTLEHIPSKERQLFEDIPGLNTSTQFDQYDAGAVIST
jgi:hypothetical protein